MVRQDQHAAHCCEMKYTFEYPEAKLDSRVQVATWKENVQ